MVEPARLLLFDDLPSSVSLFYIHATKSICIGAMKYGCCVEGRETTDLSLPHENGQKEKLMKGISKFELKGKYPLSLDQPVLLRSHLPSEFK